MSCGTEGRWFQHFIVHHAKAFITFREQIAGQSVLTVSFPQNSCEKFNATL